MSTANPLDSSSFLITRKLPISLVSLRGSEGSEAGSGPNGPGEAFGETGGVSPSRILSSQFSDERQSVCFNSLLLESRRFLFCKINNYSLCKNSCESNV